MDSLEMQFSKDVIAAASKRRQKFTDTSNVDAAIRGLVKLHNRTVAAQGDHYRRLDILDETVIDAFGLCYSSWRASTIADNQKMCLDILESEYRFLCDLLDRKREAEKLRCNNALAEANVRRQLRSDTVAAKAAANAAIDELSKFVHYICDWLEIEYQTHYRLNQDAVAKEMFRRHVGESSVELLRISDDHTFNQPVRDISSTELRLRIRCETYIRAESACQERLEYMSNTDFEWQEFIDFADHRVMERAMIDSAI